MAPKPSEQSGDLKHRRRNLILADAERDLGLAQAMYRWIIASLLLLNGGALVALLGLEDLRASLFGGPGWLFAGGALSALLAALGMAIFFADGAVELIERIWADDPLDQPTYAAFYNNAKVGFASRYVGPLFLVLSICCFILGCVEVAGVDLSAQSREDVDRSTHASRPNAPATTSAREEREGALVNSLSDESTVQANALKRP